MKKQINKYNQEPKPQKQPKPTAIQIKGDNPRERELCIKNLSLQ